MTWRNRWPALVVVGLYVLVSVVTLWAWSVRGVYPLIGDEPHYLVIGDALWRFGGIDVGAAYQAELIGRVFYPPGLGGINDPLTAYGHVVPRERGVFSWHGYLLGWVAGAPVAIFGAEAGRWIMVFFGAGVAWLVWRLAGFYFTQRGTRLAVASTLVLTYPFILASVQIFPDFFAGGAALVGIAWLLAARSGPPRAAVTVFSSSTVSLLPWLGVKFAPLAALLLVAMAIRAKSSWWLVIAPGAVSALLFAGFNAYAYGSPFGSLAEGTVEFGGDFWIRLVGMVLDQNQGVVMFNPILWLGLVGLVPFLRRDRFVGAFWGMVVLLLWVLGAAHPGWYGGGSFVGRYSWGMALLLMLPAMVTLAALLRRSRVWFSVAVIASLSFSAWVFALGVFISDAGPGVPVGLDFYNKPQDTWLESYSVLWFPLQDFFAAFYNPEWAWSYGVNYVWLVLSLSSVTLGAIRVGMRGWLVAGGVSLVSIIVSGVVSLPGERNVREMQIVQVTPGRNQPGVIVGGPVWLMRDGPYEWSIAYSAGLPPVDVVGRWELVKAIGDEVVAAGEVNGTSGAPERITIPVSYRSASPRQFFLRVFWSGSGRMSIQETGIRYVDR